MKIERSPETRRLSERKAKTSQFQQLDQLIGRLILFLEKSSVIHLYMGTSVIIKKRPAHLSIVERLGGFWCCKGSAFFLPDKLFILFLLCPEMFCTYFIYLVSACQRAISFFPALVWFPGRGSERGIYYHVNGVMMFILWNSASRIFTFSSFSTVSM